MNTLTQDSDLRQKLRATLQKTFGFSDFREGQEDALITLSTQKRLLCILPTGYGKSLLYQLPACLSEGITVVISPLLALMRDQISHLNDRFGIPAAAINSDQTDEENHAARLAALQNKLKILFIAPEQLDHIDRFQFLLNLNIKLVVVDEAHCISTWGHDFRPSYRQILQFLHAISAKDQSIRILGLTATANKRVEEDIRKQLTLADREMAVIRQTLNRPNIKLSVVKTEGMAHKLAACAELLSQLQGCGLIYCATRENTEMVADYLQQNHLNVAAYHAGLENEGKRHLQTCFAADTYKALVATNALGMGIDKSNLRFIIHFDVPGSITAYYQEVGRCGRDGKEAQGILLYDKADRRIQEYFIYAAIPSQEDFQKVLQALAPTPIGLIAIKSATGLHPTRVTIILAELQEQGFIEKQSVNGKQVYRLLPRTGSPNLSRYHTQKEAKSQELDQMLSYSEQAQNCRMALLRATLGDESPPPCQHCDVCKNEVRMAMKPDLARTTKWLAERPVPIAGYVRDKISGGISLLDSRLRLPLFIDFMKHRSTPGTLNDDLLALLFQQCQKLAQKHRLAGIIPIPSRTWPDSLNFAKLLANQLKIDLIDILEWQDMPLNRQGELLNNDQRHQNVHARMQCKFKIPLPQGTFILFDDYIGSGNTIREAARALKSLRQPTTEIVPVTIASLKWHLGKPGFG